MPRIVIKKTDKKIVEYTRGEKSDLNRFPKNKYSIIEVKELNKVKVEELKFSRWDKKNKEIVIDETLKTEVEAKLEEEEKIEKKIVEINRIMALKELEDEKIK